MKKLIIAIVIVLAGLFLLYSYVHNLFYVDITTEDLPQEVYENEGDLLLIAQSKLIALANPLSLEDDYTLTEEFLNYMLLYSLRENVNEDYNPLSDTCEDDACSNVFTTEYGNIEYVFVSLTDNDQILLTINFNRQDMPSIETALFATFDVEVSLIDLELRLVLDEVFLNETEITKDNLDTIVSMVDVSDIESMTAIGSIDLEEYQYVVSLLP
jgi:hypothetical protein